MVAPLTGTVTGVVAPLTGTVTSVVAPLTGTVTGVGYGPGRDVAVRLTGRRRGPADAAR